MRRDAEQFALGGVGLPEDKIDRLEKNLAKHPNDLDSRLLLLGAYLIDRFKDSELQRRWSDHALWFVKHFPESEIAGSPLCQVMENQPRFDDACSTWESAVASHPASVSVIWNASRFFTLSNPKRTEELLLLGERIAPSLSRWADQLGSNLMRTVTGDRDSNRQPKVKPDDRLRTAADAFRHFERALGLADSSAARFKMLPDCADAAFEAGRLPEALRYANEIVDIAPQCSLERHRPDFLHTAHIVRGLIALQKGDEDRACNELEAAGEQGGADAPVLCSFGPSFLLANRLLERGRKDAVLAFLDQCATFWNPERIEVWRDAIVMGRTPWMNRFFFAE